MAPQAPRQRGSKGTTGGLLRQSLPKGANLSAHSQKDLDHIAKLMSERPRKTLGWRTPAEAFVEEIATALQLELEPKNPERPHSSC